MGQKSSKQPRVDSRYLAPQKLSCFNEVDLRKLRRLIKDRKLAPCFPGVDSESRELEDCPICFLKYPSLNRAVCCHKPICTECFLQVKSLKPGHSPACPYCKADFSIYFQGPASAEQRLKAEDEDKEQAFAMERSRQGDQQGSSHPHHLPAVPCCPSSVHTEQARQPAPASMAKMPLQAASAEMHLWDYLPHDLLIAEAVNFEVDLDEAMLMQGISASLEQLKQSPASSSRMYGLLDNCHTLPAPAQLLEPDPHAAQQAGRAASGSALAPAGSVQPKMLTGPVILHSSGGQEPPLHPVSSQTGAGTGHQVGHGPAAAAAVLHSSAGSHELLLPASGSQSDGVVHLSVTSTSMQPTSVSLNPPTAADSLTSSLQFGSPSKPLAAFSSAGAPLTPLCSPQVLQSTSSARNSGTVDSLPQPQCSSSTFQRSTSATKGTRVESKGAGDTLAGLLQDQAKVPHVGAQTILPQPASGTHELFVGMVLTDFTIVPSAGQQRLDSSHCSEAQCGVRQSMKNRPGCPSSSEASVSMQGSVQMPSGCSGCMATKGKHEHGDAKSAPGSESVQQGMGDLTNGAVMLENPDGSVQYVVLTSDQQRAVQLSMQAKRKKDAKAAESSAYQMEWCPEDQAVQAAIAEGDAILQRLYRLPQAAQQCPTDAGSSAFESTARCTSVQHADPMLSRIEDADAKLRLLYSSS